MPSLFGDCCIAKCDKANQCLCGQQTNHPKETMFERRRLKCCFLVTFIVFLVGVIYLGYFCPEKVCAFSSGATVTLKPTPHVLSMIQEQLREHQLEQEQLREKDLKSTVSTQSVIKPVSSMCNITEDQQQIDSYLQGKIMHPNFTITDLHRNYRFDIDNDQDVIVFLHIQKTGGTTFGRHLVKNLDLTKPCKCHRGRKKCDCENHHDHVWLFSRYSTGWRCGLHADWTELTSCVNGMIDKIEGDVRYRRFLYITMIRDPYNRYLSEFRHVQRGATWKSARLECDGKQASLEEVPFCFNADADWTGVTLDQFTTCPHNLANNRQTRMLANLSLSGCYDRDAMSQERRDCIMVNSAKANLRKMAYFGLTEYQKESQYMFERTFGLKFIEDFFQYNKTHAAQLDISETQRKRILKLNRLDIEVYQYAKELFFERLDNAMREDGKVPSQVAGDNKGFLEHSSEDYMEADENEAEEDEAVNYRFVNDNEESKRVKRQKSSKHRKRKKT